MFKDVLSLKAKHEIYKRFSINNNLWLLLTKNTFTLIDDRNKNIFLLQILFTVYKLILIGLLEPDWLQWLQEEFWDDPEAPDN